MDSLGLSLTDYIPCGVAVAPVILSPANRAPATRSGTDASVAGATSRCKVKTSIRGLIGAIVKLTDLRGILQYVPQFREKTFIIAVDGGIVSDENFANILVDIALLRSLNIRVAVVH